MAQLSPLSGVEALFGPALIYGAPGPSFRCECGDFHDAYEESNDLAQFIHTEGITCLNESVAGACQQVFRPEGQRRAGEDIALRSDEDDPELVRGAQNAMRPLSRERAPRLDAAPVPSTAGAPRTAPNPERRPRPPPPAPHSSSTCPSTWQSRSAR